METTTATAAHPIGFRVFHGAAGYAGTVVNHHDGYVGVLWDGATSPAGQWHLPCELR